MFEIFFSASLIAIILLIWFDTDAFVEYAKLFRLDFFFFLSDFEEQQNVNPELTYPDYLVIYHQSFFTRLLSCPKCISFWLTLFSCIFIVKTYIFSP